MTATAGIVIILSRMIIPIKNNAIAGNVTYSDVRSIALSATRKKYKLIRLIHIGRATRGKKNLGEGHNPSQPFDGDWQSLIDRTADADQHALRRYRDYIGIATLLAERLGTFQEVTKIALFGTLAQPPYREPHPKKEGVLRLHFPENIDLAIWVSSLENLERFWRIRSLLLPKICDQRIKVTAIPIELHLFSAQTSEYLGCVCRHRHCPHKTLPCRQTSECGNPQHLKITLDFVSATESFSEKHCLRLFERR